VGNRCANHVTPLYLQKLALTSPTGGGRSVGMVRSRTKATEFSFFSLCLYIYMCVCVCVCVIYLYIYICVCVYFFIYFIFVYTCLFSDLFIWLDFIHLIIHLFSYFLFIYLCINLFNILHCHSPFEIGLLAKLFLPEVEKNVLYICVRIKRKITGVLTKALYSH